MEPWKSEKEMKKEFDDLIKSLNKKDYNWLGQTYHAAMSLSYLKEKCWCTYNHIRETQNKMDKIAQQNENLHYAKNRDFRDFSEVK